MKFKHEVIFFMIYTFRSHLGLTNSKTANEFSYRGKLPVRINLSSVSVKIFSCTHERRNFSCYFFYVMNFVLIMFSNELDY